MAVFSKKKLQTVLLCRVIYVKLDQLLLFLNQFFLVKLIKTKEFIFDVSLNANE